MKIGIVTYSLMIGGIETVIFNQAKYLKNYGFEVTVIETLKKGVWKSYFIENDIKVTSIYLTPFISKIQHSKKIAKELQNYDIIFMHDAPYAQSCLGLLSQNTIIFPILHSNIKSMINNAISNFNQWNKIIYVGPYLKNELLKFNQIKDDNIFLIPNGIELGNIEEKKFKPNVQRKIVYIGRLEHIQKAVLFIPDIIKAINQKIKIDIVNIYGEGDSKVELENKINELSLNHLIKLKGQVAHKDVYSVLQEHDFFIMPSFFEGLPIVLLEAMACKTIPIVSNLSGCTDFVVEQEKNGFLCKAADIDDFSKIFISALERTDLHEIRDNARETIINRFSIESMGSAYLNLILDEVKNPKTIVRSNKIEVDILGDLPYLPMILIRPVRKILRLMNLWNEKV